MGVTAYRRQQADLSANRAAGFSPAQSGPQPDTCRDNQNEWASTILDSLGQRLAVLDSRGTIVASNDAWREFSRSNADCSHAAAETGINCLDRWHEAAQAGSHQDAQILAGVRNVLSGISPSFEFEYMWSSPTGPQWFLLTAVPLRRKEGGAVITHLDVTSQKLTDRQYGSLIESLGAIVWKAEPASLRFTFVSKQTEAILGYPREQWYRQNFLASHLHPDDQLRVLASCRRSVEGKRHRTLDYRMLTAAGDTVWLHSSIHVITEGGHTKELIGIMIDITDYKRAETSLKEMTGRLLGVQEEERRRIARELHDNLNQRLALLAIGLQRLDFSPGAEPEAQVESLHTLTQELASDIHRLSHRLHPAKLEHLGLVAAINGLCRELSEQHAVRIDCLHRDVPRAIPKEAALCLFRVAQEALSNLVKHSGVESGKLELIGDRGALHLCVSDAGAGFDLRAASAKGRLGLISMQERVRTIGGRISIESFPSRGTRIVVQITI
ncbi:protein of unknown function [Nitrospira japonica]|uniref:Histidine kinase n=1 Tax=Nitrospira japonica TaxID=1325564 RepID=A0A1W1I7M8_9BACT|nr:PAS domain-containing protein [Nitrospira japonica]SLM49017.1 protein of unknown function [Nitrospira japonica]